MRRLAIDPESLVASFLAFAKVDAVQLAQLTAKVPEFLESVTKCRPDDSDTDYALSVLRADYYTSVKSIASSIVDEIRSEAASDRWDGDKLRERIEETADGNYWTIYTAANLRCMLASDNWTAIDEWNDGTGTGFAEGESLSEVTMRVAYHALLADIRDELTRVFGVDLDDPCPECEACDGTGDVDHADGSNEPVQCKACEGKGYTLPTKPE